VPLPPEFIGGPLENFMFHRISAKILAVLAVLAALAGCKATETPDYNVKPSGFGTITSLVYDGIVDDLLTAGLGVNGLQSDTAPGFVDAANPTVGELRRLAIYTNYRAQVDTTTGGGFGVIYGPNVDANGNANASSGTVPGTEFITYLDDGTGRQNVTVMVQLPLLFNRAAPCIVTATSGGSQGVYGAMATAGEWGLKRACAVVYVDKGTGLGVHDLATDTVGRIDGTRTTAATAGSASTFTATMTAAELTAYNAAFPNRIAVKHAHSQQNSERDWGLFTLRAVELALYLLNEQYSQVINGQRIRSFTAANVLVIASSVSNGGGAALAAAEQDSTGLIDGVAVAAPQIQLAANNAVSVRRGATTAAGTGKVLLDYVTYANLLQPCASLAASVADAPGLSLVNATRAGARCAALKAQGLLTASTQAAQADEALALLRAYGWEAESNPLHASHYALATPGIAVTYANAYGRFGVRDNLCGFSFAATGADLKPVAATGLASVFATGNGIPPTAGINLINNNSVGGALLDGASISPSTNTADYNVDGARCLRNLFTGTDANATRVASGINEVRRTGNLRGKPAVIVHGRADALVPPGFSSRPYFALNKSVEGATSRLAYYEITNAQHVDAFIANTALAGYKSRFVPLQRYFNNAMDIVFNNLRSGTPIPVSQVVRTTPRAVNADGSVSNLAVANVPVISTAPTTADQITFASNVATIPD
jgi:hydroxybutyrate-dimer hydrolase